MAISFFNYIRDKITEQRHKAFTEENLAAIEKLEDIFSLNGNLRILCIMKIVDAPHRIQFFEYLTNLPRTTVFKSLRKLKALGLVEAEEKTFKEPRIEKTTEYQLSEKGKKLFKNIRASHAPLNIANAFSKPDNAKRFMRALNEEFFRKPVPKNHY